jgi:hypothetical protein
MLQPEERRINDMQGKLPLSLLARARIASHDVSMYYVIRVRFRNTFEAFGPLLIAD